MAFQICAFFLILFKFLTLKLHHFFLILLYRNHCSSTENPLVVLFSLQFSTSAFLGLIGYLPVTPLWYPVSMYLCLFSSSTSSYSPPTVPPKIPFLQQEYENYVIVLFWSLYSRKLIWELVLCLQPVFNHLFSTLRGCWNLVCYDPVPHSLL